MWEWTQVPGMISSTREVLGYFTRMSVLDLRASTRADQWKVSICSHPAPSVRFV